MVNSHKYVPPARASQCWEALKRTWEPTQTLGRGEKEGKLHIHHIWALNAVSQAENNLTEAHLRRWRCRGCTAGSGRRNAAARALSPASLRSAPPLSEKICDRRKRKERKKDYEIFYERVLLLHEFQAPRILTSGHDREFPRWSQRVSGIPPRQHGWSHC